MCKINPPMVDDGDGLDQDGRGHVRAADVEQDLGKGQLKVRYGSAYLIFVISFTQTRFSKTKFYTQKND